MKAEDSMIDYQTFASKLMNAINVDIKAKMVWAKDILMQLQEIMKKTKISVFDLFCILDVNQRGGVTLLELKTGC